MIRFIIIFFTAIAVNSCSSSKGASKGVSVEQNFEHLFNGENLDGWIGNKKSYKVENGMIVIDPAGGGSGGNLYTEKEYSDFELRLEFQLTPGANNGLAIHAPLEGDAAYVGKELQILDNTAQKYADLKPYQYHGSVYGILPAKRGHLKPVGEWNHQKVRVVGSKIKVTLNGTVIVDGDFYEASKNGTLDKKNHPGLKRISGHIGFLGHGDVLRFKNIRINDLSPTPINLFNGENLDGWHVDVPAQDINPDTSQSFIVRNGKLVSLGIPQGHLITDKSYKNYRLKVRYRFVGEPGNCGVLVHASTPRALYKMFPKSIEVQMMYENAGDFWCIVEDIKVPNMLERRGPQEEWGITEGKKRRILNLTDGSERPLGEWNDMQIECLDDKLKVWLNGVYINEGYEMTAQEGQIAVQAEGVEVEFEKIELVNITSLSN